MTVPPEEYRMAARTILECGLTAAREQLDESEIEAVLDLLDERVKRFKRTETTATASGSIPSDVADRIREHIFALEFGLENLSDHVGHDVMTELENRFKRYVRSTSL